LRPSPKVSVLVHKSQAYLLESDQNLDLHQNPNPDQDPNPDLDLDQNPDLDQDTDQCPDQDLDLNLDLDQLYWFMESQACLLNQDQDQIQDPAEKDPDKNLHEEPVLCLDQDPDLGVYENFLAYWFTKVKPLSEGALAKALDAGDLDIPVAAPSILTGLPRGLTLLVSPGVVDDLRIRQQDASRVNSLQNTGIDKPAGVNHHLLTEKTVKTLTTNFFDDLTHGITFLVKSQASLHSPQV